VAAAVAACRTARGLAWGRLSDPVPGVGVFPTVGNRPDGSVGEMPVPEIVGSVPGTGSVTRGPTGLLVGFTTTTSVAEPEKESAPAADALAVSCTCSPSAALARTCTVASSSSAWPTGRLPILQVVPLATGQTLNFGESMYRAAATRALTEMPVLAAFVLQTQITKLALWPALTSDAVENDCTRTQSCGVFCPGAGEVGEPLGVGVGLGEVLELVLGSGVGLGLELAEVCWVDDGLGLPDELEAELLDEDGEDEPERDVLGLDEGLVLDDLAGAGEVLDDLLAPAEAEALPEVDALPEPAALVAAALW
jgi:hypothetical protein